MTNKEITFSAPDGSLVSVLAVDTGTSDGQGREVYRLGVDTEFTVTDITIGAVQIQDSGSSTQANVKTVTSIAETDHALAVQAPVLGKISDTVDLAGGASTINAKLRGLIQILADIWNSTVHALGIEGKGVAGTQVGGVLTVQGDPSGTPIPTSSSDDTQILAPTDQSSTSSFVDFAGSVMDTRYNSHLSYTLINQDGTNGVNWQVLAANRSDFTDKFTYLASALIAALGEGHVSIAPASYRYYKVQIQDAVGGSHASCRLTGIGKV